MEVQYSKNYFNLVLQREVGASERNVALEQAKPGPKLTNNNKKKL